MAAVAAAAVSKATIDGERIPPSQSLYVKNLPEKLQREDVRRELYMLFSTYGPVLDVTAMSTEKMRGQAHVLFKDVQGATQAMRSCQNFDFFGKEMRIAYSKSRSNTLAKLTGTFNQPTPAAEQAKPGAPPPTAFPPPPGQAPPATLPGPPSGLPPPPGLPPKVNGDASNLKPPASEAEDVASPQGTKRQRDESEDEDEDAPMEEDEDEGEMEMSDDED